jgi:hypothetical protein
MGRPKKFENGFKVVKVYLQPEEFERIFAKCGGGSVSDWARQAMLAELDGIKAVIGEYKDYGSANRVDQNDSGRSEVGRSAPMRRGSRAVVPDAERSVVPGRTCKHGIKAGNACWQCGGKAVVE